MTLQDFKDQVAREYKVWGLMRMYKDWAEVVQRGMSFQQVSILERAATLFAEHERKDGRKQGWKEAEDAYEIPVDIGYMLQRNQNNHAP